MKRVGLSVAILIFGWLHWAATEPQAIVPTGKPVYFYPKANVYFDTGNALYTYFGPEGWTQTEALPEEWKSGLGEKAIITQPVTPLWRNNSGDRMLYSVALYHTTNLSVLYQKDYEASMPKKPVVVEQAPEKEKSGLRKFFDRLFGKKKDA